MKYEYINIVGSMSIRPVPNVNNDSVGKLPMNTKAYGDTLSVLGNGDKWLLIQYGNISGWVAVIHNGNPYGKLTEIDNSPEVPTFPTSFVLTDPNGARAEYQFERIIND